MTAAVRLLSPLLPVATAIATRWISEQRDRYRALAKPLDADQRGQFQSVFEPTTLDAVRVLRVPQLENPVFVPDFARTLVGGRSVLDLRTVGGLTYGDTVLISAARSPEVTPIRLLFHELVHVVQYDLLGIEGFAEGYVRGWVESGFAYRSIPLEEQAYALEAQFAAGVLGSVSVEQRLRGGLA